MSAVLRSHPVLAGTIERHRLRARIEAAVEHLIAALDALDGDPDLEDGDDAEVLNEDGDVLDFGELSDAERLPQDQDLRRVDLKVPCAE